MHPSGGMRGSQVQAMMAMKRRQVDPWAPGPASLVYLASSRTVRDPLSLKKKKKQERKEKEKTSGGWSLRK